MTVLFDVDETLTDYAGSVRKAITAYCAELGVPAVRLPAAAGLWTRLERKNFPRYLAGELDFAGQRRMRALGMRAALGGRGPLDPDVWFGAYLAHYEASLTLYGDVLGCLDALGGRRLGVISNNDEAFTRKKLELVGISDRFAIVVGRDTFAAPKPDPTIFLRTCAELSVAPETVVYVGDNREHDAIGATAAGLTGVWLDRENTDISGFERRISTLADLPPLLNPGSDLMISDGIR